MFLREVLEQIVGLQFSDASAHARILRARGWPLNSKGFQLPGLQEEWHWSSNSRAFMCPKWEFTKVHGTLKKKPKNSRIPFFRTRILLISETPKWTREGPRCLVRRLV